jgi:hypothetical protein
MKSVSLQTHERINEYVFRRLGNKLGNHAYIKAFYSIFNPARIMVRIKDPIKEEIRSNLSL